MFNLMAKVSRTIVAALIACVFGGTVLAAPGDLDSTFGDDGIVTTPIPNESIGAASGIVIQPDGRSVVTVFARSIVGGFDLAVVRYNIDGTLDTTFSGDGIFASPFDADDLDVPGALTLQSDGKILVVGSVVDDQVGGFFILRLNSDGSLDTTFGLGGIVRISVNGASNGISISVQPDGKILAAGTAFSPEDDFFLVLRLNSNGSLDTSFGNSGSARVSFGFIDFFEDMALQTDGRIILMGNGDVSSSNPYVAMARFTSNGTLDPTFGGDGTVTTQGIGLSGTSMALQTDGKLLVGGESQGDFAVLRLNTNGSFDTSFDNDGLAVTSFGPTSDMVNDLVALPDNKIVAVGETAIGQTLLDLDVAIARFNSNGSIDTTFGTGGKVVTRIGTGSDLMNAVAIQTDGKILAAGAGTETGSSQLTAIRYLSQSRRTRFDSDGDGRADISVFRPDGSNPSIWYFLNSSNGFRRASLDSIQTLLYRTITMATVGPILQFSGQVSGISSIVRTGLFGSSFLDLRRTSLSKTTTTVTEKAIRRFIATAHGTSLEVRAVIRQHSLEFQPTGRWPEIMMAMGRLIGRSIGTASGTFWEALPDIM